MITILNERYDYIIFDTPLINLTATALLRYRPGTKSAEDIFAEADCFLA